MFYHLGLIGDVHGQISQYEEMANECKYSLQVGDLGWWYDGLTLDYMRHKFIAGNHDDYSVEEVNGIDPQDYSNPKFIQNGGELTTDGQKVWRFTNLPKHFVGHFGSWKIPDTKGKTNPDLFFVRGAMSIDDKRRIIGKDLFAMEEMTRMELESAIALYSEKKPDIVVSHTCPTSITANLHLPFSEGCVFRTKTCQALDAMLSVHRPKLWVFGHFHQSYDETIDGTRFVCVDKMGALYLDEQLSPIYAV